MTVSLQTKLKEWFGFDSFRKGQEETISALLSGCDTLTQLPTGTGKSLCYQLTGYLLDGLVVVVTPLISLMEDQVQRLRQQGETQVTYLNSQLTKEERYYILTHLATYKFLFVSPEMLQQPRLLARLKTIDLALLVVDEAHCISQWGIDFRPEYRQLHRIQAELGHPLTLALTASATPAVREEIKAHLFTRKVQEFVYSIDRPNIQLFVAQTTDKVATLQEYLATSEGPTIIYCVTRKKVEELYETLRTMYAVGYYHGGLTSNERSSLQQQFQRNQLQILIATNAFGMGIDKADIRVIIHYDLPDSIENYVQEIGRAGRDGQTSYALLLYQEQDERIHYFFQEKFTEELQQLRWLLEQKNPLTLLPQQESLQKKWLREHQQDPRFIEQLAAHDAIKKQKLATMKAYVEEQTCYRTYLLHYFAEEAAVTHPCCGLEDAHWPHDERYVQEVSPSKNWQVRLAEIFKEA